MGDKMKIGEKEYDQEELARLISQGEDYTQKTQALADKEREVEAKKAVLKSYEDLDEYMKQHPDFAPKLNQFIKKDISERYGYRDPEVNAPQKAQANRSRGNYTNVYAGDYSGAGADDLDLNTGDDNNDADKPLTKAELAKILAERDKLYQMNDTNKEVNKRLREEYEMLRTKGYTEDEIKRVASTAQKSSRWFVETAKQLAFDGVIPDRFKKKDEEPKPGEGFAPLKGQSASGFELPDEEKDLVKYGGNPIEWLRDHSDKLLKKE
jgi:vacuolar-type H+-ATPase subunit I/STV1